MLLNSNGSPLILYHGTNFQFDKFEPFHKGKSCRNPTTDFGFFFTESVDDAWSWAKRGSERSGVPSSPRVMEVSLNLDKVFEMTFAKFNFYLQRAKVSTMQRDKKQWQADGYDGFTVVREGCKWYLPFDESKIEIVGCIEAEAENIYPRPR